MRMGGAGGRGRRRNRRRADREIVLSDNTLQHSLHSTFREAVLEHLLLGELLKYFWLAGTHAEVLKPNVDDAGYDVVIEADGIMRHIQFKGSYSGAKTARQKVHLELGKKPSGCVIWMIFEPETLAFESFRWFGGRPGEPLPNIEEFKVAKHTKGDAEGTKKERPQVRVVPRGKFEVVDTIPDLVNRLFGVGSTSER